MRFEEKATTEKSAQQTQNICIIFLQCGINVKDIGPTSYKCYTSGLCLLVQNVAVVLSQQTRCGFSPQRTATQRSRYILLCTCTPACRRTSLLFSTPVCLLLRSLLRHIADGGPASSQQWVNVLCMLGTLGQSFLLAVVHGFQKTYNNEKNKFY